MRKEKDGKICSFILYHNHQIEREDGRKKSGKDNRHKLRRLMGKIIGPLVKNIKREKE